MRQHKKYTMRWLRSLLGVLLVCLLLCSVLCMYLLSVLEKNVEQTNTGITSFLQKSIDSRLMELNRYSITVELSQTHEQLKKLTQKPEEIPPAAYQLSILLQNYMMTNQLASGIYIYYPNAQLVVGNMGCFSADSYYALQEIPHRDGYEEWCEELSRPYKTRFRLVQLPQTTRFCYVRELWMQGEVAATIVIEINSEKMLQDFHAENLPLESATGILLEGVPVDFSGEKELFDNVPKFYQEWQKDPKPCFKKDGLFAFFNPSELPGIDYVSICSAEGLLHSVRVPLYICVAGTLLCFVLGAAAAVWMSLRNARPMKNLLQQLGEDGSNSGDEYQFLARKIDEMMNETHKSQELLQRHQLLLNGLFLNTVLRGGLHSENAIFAAAKRYEVSFEFPNYQIMVLAGKGREIPDGSPELELLQKSFAELGLDALVSAYGGRYVVMLNSEEKPQEQELNQLTKTLMEKIFPDQPAHAGVGPCYDSMVDIVTSYNCALLALQTIESALEHPVSHYQPNQVHSGFGDCEVMRAFGHHLYSKQFIQAQRLLERLHTEYLYVGASSETEIMRQNAVDNLLADTLREILPAEEAEKEVRALIAPGPPDEQRRQTEHALEVLVAATTKASGTDEKEPVAVRAKRIVNENFADPMMGLYLVSEQLGVSNSYLCTTFKNTYGISIIAYINRLRVDQAKSLILNTDMNIKEIAQAVGFSSDINFIRVFKKLENHTPATLRKEGKQ